MTWKIAAGTEDGYPGKHRRARGAADRIDGLDTGPPVTSRASGKSQLFGPQRQRIQPRVRTGISHSMPSTIKVSIGFSFRFFA